MRIILFTTTDLLSGRYADFERLLESLATQNGHGFTIQHYVLLQNATTVDTEQIRRKAPEFCRITAIPDRVSLSAARNHLLRYAMHIEPCDEASIIGFPDDDCWLPPHLLSSLSAIFSSQNDLDLFICRVSLDPDVTKFTISALRDAAANEVIRVASSNSIFLRGSLARTLGAFDVDLGLGTPSKGGEDTDYAVRAFLLARRTGIINEPLVGHRTSDLNSIARYFPGALNVLARYANCHPTLMWEFRRKFLIGAYLVVRGVLPLSTYIAAFAEGVRIFWKMHSRPQPLAAPLEPNDGTA